MKLIKNGSKWLTAFCLFFSYTVIQADIIDANEAYENQNYESAFEQYLELAQLGNSQARYNVAVMYLKGQGTLIDYGKAYGWAQLVDYENNADLINLVDEIEKKLTKEELDEAKTAAEVVKNNFGDDAIYSKLAPISYQAKDPSDNKKEFNIQIINRPAPRYPMSEYRRGTQGWVRVGFEVYPDGSARNIYVIESVPAGIFDEVTLEAVERFKFKASFAEGVEPYPVSARQTIQYELPVNDEKKLTKLYQQHLEKLEKLAHKGHPDAQYYYALAASSQSLVNRYVKLDDVAVNDWLLKAAQNGNLDAQYQLGQNILSGKGCKVEKQKGIDWIVYAADKGHPKAARKAYHLLTKNQHLNNTNLTPEHWLKQAADQGDPESQLDYAHFLAFNGSETDKVRIEKYLEQYLEERDKSVKYYQVKAQLYRLENNEKKAQKELKKANKLAKKLGWEV